jgi:hypothetical protein
MAKANDLRLAQRALALADQFLTEWLIEHTERAFKEEPEIYGIRRIIHAHLGLLDIEVKRLEASSKTAP